VRCRQRRPEVLSSGWAGNSMARVAVRDRKGPVPCSKPALEVELRGFEPLTPSMRTLGSEVARGRWGRSPVDGGLSESFSAGRVAVLSCCTAPSRARMQHGPRRRRRDGVMKSRAWGVEHRRAVARRFRRNSLCRSIRGSLRRCELTDFLPSVIPLSVVEQ
jgi:hypothetical protein